MLNLLNPGLFSDLERRFGKGNVEVVSAGFPFVGHREPIALDQWIKLQRINDSIAKLREQRADVAQNVLQARRSQRRVSEQLNKAGHKSHIKEKARILARPTRLVVDDQGEEYKVDCPFCNDTRKRCYINHRWGSDPEHRDEDLFLIQCFNEQCFSDYRNRRDFYDQVRVFVAPGMYSSSRDESSVAAVQREDMELPGLCVSLEDLANSQPDHPAIDYIVGRDFDPIYLSREFGVSYCPTSRYALAADRIIIPMYFDAKLMGWQARALVDKSPRNPGTGRRIPKYWTSPGFEKSKYGYGLDDIVGAKLVVLVEGPMDRWSVGKNAVALLGKTIRSSLVEKIGNRVDRGASIVILLDPEQDEIAKRKHKPHHIDTVHNKVASHFGPEAVTSVWLPLGTDPGSIGRELLWEIIHSQLWSKRVREVARLAVSKSE